ncbi:MAG: hypothetical protein IJ086_00675 [Clostridium sp.]|nr:hypothetical protein [Clostridium sp.]
MRFKIKYKPQIKHSMVKKFISTTVAMGLLLNNVSSVASVLPEDSRYETFEGDNITVDNVLEESKVDVEIEGNTMVNLMKKVVPRGVSGEFTENNDIYRITRNSSGNSQYLQFEFINSQILKANTLYTLIVPKYKTNCSSKGAVRLYDRTNEKTIAMYKRISDEIYTIETAADLDVSNSVVQLLIYIGDGEELGRYVECSNRIMMFEGDLTNNHTYKYFEGIQSSFEDQLITQEMVDRGEEKQENLGKYKVEVKSTGKNLFDMNSAIPGFLSSMELYGTDYIEVVYPDYENMLSDFIKVEPGKTYTYTYSGYNNTHGLWTGYVFFKEADMSTFVSDRFVVSNDKFTITIPEGVNYIRIGSRYLSQEGITVQLEEGPAATKYESYKELVKTFYLNSPLLKGDTIDYINGQPTHIRRYNKVVLDGSDDEDLYEYFISDANRKTICMYIENLELAGMGSSESYSDSFIFGVPDAIANEDYEHHRLMNTGRETNRLYIWINRSRLSTVDIEGFRLWLKENPVSVVYKLAKSIYEPIKTDLSIQLFEGTTHISNNSTITANMKVVVDRTINRATEAIQEARINPTPQNISIARMWANLLEDSALKDEIQQEISDIVVSEDIEMERKTVSSNMDVYIRSENVLSMSLSTNSVIFDDYSGVDDNEKLNAVDVIVSSSLPYALNTYLETPIESNSGNVISNTVLSIRESGGTYQSFSNTDNKIVLNSDCESTELKSHSIDLKVSSDKAINADVYKTTVKFEAVQK